jgi:predicted amidohydrolase YtcJ
VNLLLVDVVLRDRGPTRVRLADGRVSAVGADLVPDPAEEVIDGRGGLLLPGLADHHLHLAATAAHATSADLEGRDLIAALREATPDGSGWVRAVGYDERRHGDLSRTVLDQAVPGRPVRVQHRSGALWVLNTAGLAAIGAYSATVGGIERDPDGVPTGRLWRCDDWLRTALPERDAPSLRALGATLAGYGLTHLTEASPDPGPAQAAAAAVRAGDLPQHLLLLAEDLTEQSADHPRIAIGPVKIVTTDHALPGFEELCDRICRAHGHGRPVAVHCVTRAALALTLSALAEAGVREGDRIEHAAVAGPPEVSAVAALGVRVVTQPSLVERRGDDYLARVDPPDRRDLWPYASLVAAGVRVAPSSDAPYGDPDPWRTIRAAVGRRTTSGRRLGPGEAVSAEQVLDGYLSAPSDPGGAPRRVAPGATADLVLLEGSLADVLAEPDAGRVRATLVEGALIGGGA